MSDARYRAALRRHDVDPSPAAAHELVTEWVRMGAPVELMPLDPLLTPAWLHAGGRDPRRDPKPGDRVAAASPYHDGRHYKPRVWEVVPLPSVVLVAIHGRESERLVRRARTGADGKEIVETILMHSWRRFAREGRVIRVACATCHGSGNGVCAICSDTGRIKCTAHGPSCIYGCMTTNCLACEPWPPRCAACFGTGHAISGIPAQETLSAKQAM